MIGSTESLSKSMVNFFSRFQMVQKSGNMTQIRFKGHNGMKVSWIKL